MKLVISVNSLKMVLQNNRESPWTNLLLWQDDGDKEIDLILEFKSDGLRELETLRKIAGDKDPLVKSIVRSDGSISSILIEDGLHYSFVLLPREHSDTYFEGYGYGSAMERVLIRSNNESVTDLIRSYSRLLGLLSKTAETDVG